MPHGWEPLTNIVPVSENPRLQEVPDSKSLWLLQSPCLRAPMSESPRFQEPPTMKAPDYYSPHCLRAPDYESLKATDSESSQLREPQTQSTHMARASEKTSAWMCIMRSPPAAYSITKHTCSLVWKQANRLTRNGCRTLFTVSKILFSHMRLHEKHTKPQHRNRSQISQSKE